MNKLKRTGTKTGTNGITISLIKLSKLKHDLVKFQTLFGNALAKLPDSPDKRALTKGFRKVIVCLIDEIYGLINGS